MLDSVVFLEWLPMFCVWCSSFVEDLPDSALLGRDTLDLDAKTEVLEPFKEVLGKTTGLGLSESREGGSGLSGKFDAWGDCSLEEGTEIMTGDDTAVAVGL